MSKKLSNFRGLGTAVITPFKGSEDIDYKAMDAVIEHQIKGRTDYIVVAGTTGEGSVLDDEELMELLKFSIDKAKGKTGVVAGCGGNDTRDLCKRIKEFNSLNLDAYLVVTPYYNKPTQEGLYKHYRAVVDAAGNRPIILYNVPGRTSVRILPETVARLARECPSVVAIKEASGEIAFAMEMYSTVKKNGRADFVFLSGDDAATLPLISIGYEGVISVVGNETPGMIKDIVDNAVNNNYSKAMEIHYKLLPLMNANFIETSPSPVKYAMKRLGIGDGSVRLPLSEMSKREQMDNVLRQLALI